LQRNTIATKFLLR